VRYEERGEGYRDVEKVGKHWTGVWAYQTVNTALDLLLNQGSIKRYFVHEV
jgi:hypothetical protein